MIPVTLLALTSVLLLFREPATAVLNQWIGTNSRSSAGRPATTRALALLVMVVLLFALDPEVRAVLVFVDMIGVDIFLMLLLFQGREILQWVSIAMCMPAMRFLETWSWYPMPLPSGILFKQHPWWSLYATAQPVAIALLVSVPVGVLGRSLRDTLT